MKRYFINLEKCKLSQNSGGKKKIVIYNFCPPIHQNAYKINLQTKVINLKLQLQ